MFGASTNDPEARLAAIHAYWRKYPGAAPGGTGETGLLKNDAQGWSDLLNMQTEESGLRGRPLRVRAGAGSGAQAALAGLRGASQRLGAYGRSFGVNDWGLG